MTFIITLVALIIERFFHWGQLRHWRWFVAYQTWLSSHVKHASSYLLLALCIVPFVLLVGLMNGLLCGWFYGVFQFIFGVIILIYCLGPQNLWVQTYSCINQLHKEDPKLVLESVEKAFGISPPESPQSFHQAFVSAIFIAGYRRVFGVVFWFVVLGPMGAVLYRMIALCAEGSPMGVTQAATRLQSILDWIPVRILTFLFALAGHFTKVFSIWKRSIKEGLHANDNLLRTCGIASLDYPLSEEGSAEKEALTLLDRAFIIGLVIVAIVVLMYRL